MSQRSYITTPIYYVNDRPHIGHAYCTILADATRRYQILLGSETYFVTGTDEHGQKVEQAAHKRGVDAQNHVDKLHLAFKDLWPTLLCEPDQFIRTTEPRHHAVVQRALQELFDQGLIFEREFEGWYSTVAERFWTEKELVDGKCPDTGQVVVRLKEKNYFFSMSRFQAPLIEAIESKQMEIVPANRANEVLSFLREPLQDLCISRPKERLKWGIELPFDRDFVAYVWFDALLNYVTAIGGLGAPERAGADGFSHWWPNVTHFLGKDILTTHAVYWPTMLMALGLPPPHRLVTTGWWLIDNTKMSKSLGNVVDPLSLKDKYGPEVLRYFLLREMSVGQDANFSEEGLVRRNNADLANDFGNLVQRTLALCERYFGSLVPEMQPDQPDSTAVQAALQYGDFLLGRRELPSQEAQPIAVSLREFKLQRAIADVMSLVSKLNQILTFDAPFKTVKTDPAAAGDTIYRVLDGIRFAANLLQPVLPLSAREILRRIGWHSDVLQIDQLQWGQLQAGAAIHQGEPLFPKYEFHPEIPTPPAPLVSSAQKKLVDANQGQTIKLPATVRRELKAEAGATSVQTGESLVPFRTGEFRDTDEPDDTVDLATFARGHLRVGRVLACEAVPKSARLLRLSIDLNEAVPRQIVSGIAETVAPADLVNKQVLVIANLPPRKLMGLVSHGMLLVAEDADGRRVPLHPARDVPNGSEVK